jgi:hypothetical protein
MSDDFRKQLYRNLNQKETDELIEIWQANNHIEWTEMTFDLIREILRERLSELPPQNKPIVAPTPQRTTATKYCHGCGREAQTKHAFYMQNIGVIIMRFTKHIEGYFCKDCQNEYFWSFTGTTFVLGWWGLISFIITLFAIPNNIINYIGTLGLKSPDATKPRKTLTDDVIERIKPYTAELFQRLNYGEDIETVARSIAERAIASPEQVIAFGFALGRELKERKA